MKASYKRESRDAVAALPPNPNGNAAEGKRDDFVNKTASASAVDLLRPATV